MIPATIASESSPAPAPTTFRALDLIGADAGFLGDLAELCELVLREVARDQASAAIGGGGGSGDRRHDADCVGEALERVDDALDRIAGKAGVVPGEFARSCRAALLKLFAADSTSLIGFAVSDFNSFCMPAAPADASRSAFVRLSSTAPPEAAASLASLRTSALKALSCAFATATAASRPGDIAAKTNGNSALGHNFFLGSKSRLAAFVFGRRNCDCGARVNLS